MFESLREYIEQVRREGRLEELTGIDPNLEMGVLAELLVHRRREIVALCSGFGQNPTGCRVLINPMNDPGDLARVLGIQQEVRTKKEIISSWRGRYKSIDPIAIQYQANGEILKNVLSGGDVDLNLLPPIQWHEKDGGRFLGTGCVLVVRDPETGVVNLGTYRTQLQGAREITALPLPGKDAWKIRQKYYDKGERCPVAICLGQAPDLFLVACSSFPWNISEYDIAGGLRGRPVEVVKGPMTGLPIPASAEMVLEGEWTLPGEKTALEGPFGEWTGYYASGPSPEPVIEVTGICFRPDPVILGCPPVRPPGALFAEIRVAARIWDELEQAGVPGICAVNMVPGGGGRFFSVVAINSLYQGHAKQVARIAAQCGSGAFMGRFTVVVDADVDIFDTEEVIWAISTRCDPKTDIEVLEGCWSSSLDPVISPQARANGEFTNSRGLIDATIPFRWKKDFPATIRSPREIEEQILTRFPHLFARKSGVKNEID